MPHPHLLELSAWPWLERLSAREHRRITLASVPTAEWDAIAARGFHIVYLMGVWKRSPVGRQLAATDPQQTREYDRVLPGWTPRDVAGSPYSIQAYEPDARMGGWRALAECRRALHARGLSLVLDFVPNHTGFDHPWVRKYPERYVAGSPEDYAAAPGNFRMIEHAGVTRAIACGRDPYFEPWRDVAQLNHFNPDTRTALVRELRRIAAHCDGVRCDMAMLLLNEVFDRTWRGVLRDRWPVPLGEFWPGALAPVPELLSIAEVYWDLEWTLQQQGFHYTYDKRLLDRLRHESPASVRAHLSAAPHYANRLVRFVENHDEPRQAVALGSRLPAAATLVMTLPGLRFLFDGQTDGRRLRIPVQLGRWPVEPLDSPTVTLYDRLLAAAADPLFHQGSWTLLDVVEAGDDSFGDLLAYSWRLDNAIAIVAVNLGPRPAQGHVVVLPVMDRQLGSVAEFALDDRLSGDVYVHDAAAVRARGMFVRLTAGAAHVFFVRLPT